MEWVAELKHHTREMYRQIQTLCERYPIQHPQERQCVGGLLRSTDNFEAWVRALPNPHDSEVWQWFDWGTIAYDVNSELKALKGYFDLLLALSRQRDYVVNPHSLSPCAEIIQKQITLISDIYHQSQITHSRYQWSFDSETAILSAYTVLGVLWPCVYAWRLERTLSLSAFDMESWPDVIYHPYHTRAMLYHVIIDIIPNSRNILVMPRQSEAAFEICVTHPTIYMTPSVWEAFLSRFRSNHEIEYLRELGGSIEPLTWDEGQGQGVIVRLPWAKT